MESHLQAESQLGTGQTDPGNAEVGSLQPPSDTEAKSAPAIWLNPEAVVVLGIVLGVVSLFLPWWSWTLSASGGTYDTAVPQTMMITATGFQGWGIVYFVIWLILVAFLFVRTVGRVAVRTFTLPFADCRQPAQSDTLR